MTELFAYWIVGCGILVQVWLLWNVGKILGAVLYAAVAASSITRWAWACAREHGFVERRFPAWMYAPAFWFGFFMTELGARPGQMQRFGGAGQWSGIGNWVVFPKKEAA